MEKVEELELIQTFEPIFIEAGRMAARHKEKAVSSRKLNSGFEAIDIVTSSDLEVQEFILQKLAGSGLANCELVAEENTPSKKLFAEHSKYVLTVDPIDGTMLYSRGKKTYSIIITLHDKTRPIYTFDYYPELGFGVKIVNDTLEFIGEKPLLDFEIERFPLAINHSAYCSKSPEDNIPELSAKLAARGYKFIDKKKVSMNLGAMGQFMLGYVDGTYVEDGSAVDCLVGLHYAMASGYEVYQDIDLSKAVKGERGNDVYGGWYLALNVR